jgi:hypothetical protein
MRRIYNDIYVAASRGVSRAAFLRVVYGRDMAFTRPYGALCAVYVRYRCFRLRFKAKLSLKHCAALGTFSRLRVYGVVKVFVPSGVKVVQPAGTAVIA